MPIEIIATIIGAAAILVASIITAVVQTINNRRLYTRLQQIEAVTVQSSIPLQEKFVQSCGYKTSSINMRMRMIDLEGKTEMITRHQGFKVIIKDLTIAYIPGGAWVQHPNGYVVQ